MDSMRLVMVEWVDAFGCSADWQELVEGCRPKPIVCKSVGWLFYDEPDCKVIVPHIADASENTVRQGCGDMTIPTKCITRIIDLIEAEQDPS